MQTLKKNAKKNESKNNCKTTYHILIHIFRYILTQQNFANNSKNVKNRLNKLCARIELCCLNLIKPHINYLSSVLLASS